MVACSYCNQLFKWTAECQNAFKLLREKLVSAPILAFPDFTQEFILHVDASDFAIGMVLSQIQNDTEVILAYSRLTLDQSDLSATEREALAVSTAIKYYTLMQNKAWRWCGAPPPPPIIFEGQNLPQQTVYHWKANLSKSPIHFKHRQHIF